MQQRMMQSGMLVAILTLAGCSDMAKKFTSENEVNLEPFAVTTIQMVSTIDYGLERNESILTKQYLKPDDKPELQRLLDLDAELYRVLQGIVGYSVKLVSLSSSTRTSKQKVEAFADYIEKLDKPALAYHIQQGNLKEEDFTNILTNIRRQEDLLSAMQAAQPMIEFVLQHVDSLTYEISRQEIKAENEIEQAIDKDYAREIDYVKMLLSRRDVVLEALIWIDEFYKGNNKALKKMNGSHVLSRLGMKNRAINKSNIKQVEQELVSELTDIQRRLDMMETESDYYMKVHKELDDLVRFHDQDVRKAKSVIQIWSNAHTKMANGVTDPADWFDFSDPGGEFFGLLKTAIIK